MKNQENSYAENFSEQEEEANPLQCYQQAASESVVKV